MSIPARLASAVRHLLGTLAAAIARGLQGTSAPAGVRERRGVARQAGTLALLAGTAGALLALSPSIAQASFGYGLPSGSFGSGQLTNPVGVAVDQSNRDVYVANLFSSNVDKFDSTGNLLSPPSPFGSGSGLYSGTAINPTNGQVDVMDAGSQTVETYDPNSGAPLSSFPVPGSANLFNAFTVVQIASDAAGNVYVPNAPNNEIQVFSPSGGTPSGVAATITGSGSSTLNAPTGVAVDSAGNVWIADTGNNRIEEFSPSGAFITSILSSGVEDVAVDASGDVFASDSPSSGSHVVEYSSTGMQTDDFGTGTIGTSSFNSPNSIAIDSASGDLYVADGGNSVIWVFAPLPTVTTGPASSIAQTSATLNGTVNPNGTAVTSCEFQYGTSSAYGQSMPCAQTPAQIGSGKTPAPVSANLTGVQPDTTYHFRLVVGNAGGTSDGADQSFGPPAVEHMFTSDVTPTSFALNAQIDPHASATTYHFEYGTSSSYGTSVPVPDAGIAAGSPQTVTQRLTDLTAGTTYHWRVVAANASGTTTSGDHIFTTPGLGGPFALPDGRGYEMVSPAAKNSADATSLLSPTRSSASGDAVSYSSVVNAYADPSGGNFFNQYIARRGTSGWSTQSITPPMNGATWIQSVTKGDNMANPWLAFAPDLSAGMVQSGDPPLTTDASQGQLNFYLARYAPGSISYQLMTDVAPPNSPPSSLDVMPVFAGASADFSHVVFVEASNLTSNAPTGSGQPQVDNVYEWVGGQLRLVNVGPDGTPLAQGAVVGLESRESSTSESLRSFPAFGINDLTHAVSDDGSRIFFTDESDFALYVREDGTTTKLVSASHQTGADPTVPHQGIFQGASADGSKVLFESDDALTNDATPGYNLYQYEVDSGQLTDLTTGDPNGANVELGGVVGSSEDGSYVYFVATGVLAPGATGGQPNLYLSHAGSTTLIARLDPSDWVLDESNLGVSGGHLRNVRLTPDGTHLAFESVASVTGYDNTDANTGQPDSEVFLYDAPTNQLSCASCNPTGARPLGSSTLGFAQSETNFVYYPPRNLSDNGSRLFFDSNDSLAAGDSNGRQDVYEYEREGTGSCSQAGGCIYLISRGTSSDDAGFLDASPSGSDVFFATRQQLVPQDTDDLIDLYDARVGGGFPYVPPGPPCTASDTCKAPFGGAPPLPTAASVTFSGPGNLKPGSPLAKVKVLTRVVHGSRFFFRVKVPSRGQITITGAGIRTATRSVSRAGTYAIRVTLTQAARGALVRKRKLKLRLRVAYAPSGASASTVTLSVTVEPALRHRAKRTRKARRATLDIGGAR